MLGIQNPVAVVKEQQVMTQTIKCHYCDVSIPRDKLGETRSMCYQLDLEIIALTETWLSPYIMDGKVKLQGMTASRHDKVYKSGSRVTIYVNIHFKAVTPQSNELTKVTETC